MAKYPRSKRKMFQIVKVHDCITDYYEVYVYNNSNKVRYIDGLFGSKKKARQYIARKRRAIKNRLW